MSIDKNYRQLKMQGRERTRPTNDLGLIFFHIRTTRCTKTRRSWQRRARIALSNLKHLSEKDKHEIMCTWSRDDCHMVNSESMHKLLKPSAIYHTKSQNAHRTPTLRAKFDRHGQRVSGTKKPEKIRLDFGDAANDPIECSPDTPQHSQRPGIHALNGVHAPLLFQHPQRSYRPTEWHAQGGSGESFASACGNPAHLHARAMHWRQMPQMPPKKPLSPRIFYKSFSTSFCGASMLLVTRDQVKMHT